MGGPCLVGHPSPALQSPCSAIKRKSICVSCFLAEKMMWKIHGKFTHNISCENLWSSQILEGKGIPKKESRKRWGNLAFTEGQSWANKHVSCFERITHFLTIMRVTKWLSTYYGRLHNSEVFHFHSFFSLSPHHSTYKVGTIVIFILQWWKWLWEGIIFSFKIRKIRLKVIFSGQQI